MNAFARRVSRLEAQMGLSVKAKAQLEREQTAAEKIWEAQRSRMTKEELVIDDQKMAILDEACRGHTSIAEAIWSGQRALKKFEAKRREGRNE